MHYHLTFGSIRDIKYESYEDSIKDFTNFSIMFYKGPTLNIENAFKATKNPHVGTAIVVGAPTLPIFWRVCEECIDFHSN